MHMEMKDKNLLQVKTIKIFYFYPSELALQKNYYFFLYRKKNPRNL